MDYTSLITEHFHLGFVPVAVLFKTVDKQSCHCLLVRLMQTGSLSCSLQIQCMDTLELPFTVSWNNLKLICPLLWWACLAQTSDTGTPFFTDFTTFLWMQGFHFPEYISSLLNHSSPVLCKTLKPSVISGYCASKKQGFLIFWFLFSGLEQYFCNSSPLNSFVGYWLPFHSFSF